MRWTIRIGTALALLWAVYALSPYFAAYRLVTAVQARDVEALKERVNFHAVRISLAQQILAVYFSATGEGNVSEAAVRQLASVAAEVAEPLIAQLLSPEVLVDLLDDGWPQSVVSERAPQIPDEPAPEGRSETSPPSWPQSKASRVGLGSPQLTWRDLLTMVDMRGFRRFYLTFPGVHGAASRIRLSFRFRPWSWRLDGIEIPDALARRLTEELRKRVGRMP
jgi:hypothetical protein